MSQGMDPYLAELFNTNGHAEKVAYVQDVTGAFIKQAEDEGYDLSDLDEETLVDAALQWAEDMEEGDEGYDEQYLEGPGNLGPKTSEVDFLGRYMAHAYNDELEKIAKMADIGQAIKGTAGEYGQRIAKSKVGKWAGEKLHRLGALTMGVGKKSREARLEKRLSKAKERFWEEAGPTVGGRSITDRDVWALKNVASQMKRRGAKALGIGAGTAAVGGAGAAALASRKEKKSHVEMIDDAAIERANELLKLAGEGYNIGFEDVAETDEDDLDRVITELAWEKLRDEGYINE